MITMEEKLCSTIGLALNGIQMNLPWIDVESTGLNPDEDSLLQVGMAITSQNLQIIDQIEVNIAQNEPFVHKMSDFVLEMHKKSGLIKACLSSNISLDEAENKLILFMKRYEAAGNPMCGNSIQFDRAILNKKMPNLARMFHYRNIDVSTLKNLAKLWYPNEVFPPNENKNHTGLSDLNDSIDELKHYRKNILR